tara:strand:+ start:75 stop:626 length:552 start_codon:yes stop_codon:yes gene_type:complete
MLNNIIDSLETKIYAVYDNLEYKEVNSIENGYNSKPKPFFVVEKKNKGKTTSLFNSEFFAHSQYTFYNKNIKQTTINISDWLLLKVFEPRNRSREVFYSISDPLGEIREISNLSLNPNNWSKYFQIDGVCKIIELIREISKCPDWSYYDLAKENESLKETIEKLSINIEKLEARIEELEGNDE